MLKQCAVALGLLMNLHTNVLGGDLYYVPDHKLPQTITGLSNVLNLFVDPKDKSRPLGLTEVGPHDAKRACGMLAAVEDRLTLFQQHLNPGADQGAFDLNSGVEDVRGTLKSTVNGFCGFLPVADVAPGVSTKKLLDPLVRIRSRLHALNKMATSVPQTATVSREYWIKIALQNTSAIRRRLHDSNGKRLKQFGGSSDPLKVCYELGRVFAADQAIGILGKSQALNARCEAATKGVGEPASNMIDGFCWGNEPKPYIRAGEITEDLVTTLDQVTASLRNAALACAVR